MDAQRNNGSQVKALACVKNRSLRDQIKIDKLTSLCFITRLVLLPLGWCMQSRSPYFEMNCQVVARCFIDEF